MLALAAIFTFVSQAADESPSVQTRVPIDPEHPFSVVFEIKNRSFLPIFSATYTCELPAVRMQWGAFISNVKLKNAESRQTLWGKQNMTAPCETPAGVDLPVAKAELELSVSYYQFLWPYEKKSKYLFVAVIDKNGQIVSWAPASA